MRMRYDPARFLWGAAISAHQSEGGNRNSDAWLLETLPESVFAEPSGAACDSYARYEEDLDIARSIGLNCYRFGVEWARIEPEPGVFSVEALDHYRRVLEACHARDLLPVVTCNHFTAPLWFAARGGWEDANSPALFARFCARLAGALGDLIGMASTFNEANIHLLIKLLRSGHTPEQHKARTAMIAAAAARTGDTRFSSLIFADPDRIDANLLEAHAQGYQALKSGLGEFPVGVTLSMQAFEPVGDNSLAAVVERRAYGDWWAAVDASDFIGVQTYTRLRINAAGLVPPDPGAEITAAGYEYCTSALGVTIRAAAARTDKPIFVTESGIATDDDTRRAAWLDATIAEVAKCRAEGIDVKSYIYWSLLDNFEWTHGYAQRFGLVAVDRTDFARSPKPSAAHFARCIRAGLSATPAAQPILHEDRR